MQLFIKKQGKKRDDREAIDFRLSRVGEGQSGVRCAFVGRRAWVGLEDPVGTDEAGDEGRSGVFRELQVLGGEVGLCTRCAEFWRVGAPPTATCIVRRMTQIARTRHERTRDHHKTAYAHSPTRRFIHHGQSF